MNLIKCYVNSISIIKFLLFLLYFKEIFWQLALAGVYLFYFLSDGVAPHFCLNRLLDVRS